MKLTITGYSTALFSTWYFIEELGLLFDCGDGVTAALLQKSRKIENVFISHADRDHLAGLLQFNQLNARDNFPIIHYPKDCGSFPALADFSTKFDPHVNSITWRQVIAHEKIWIRKDIYVEPIFNNHVPTTDGKTKSLGYRVIQVKYKLKQTYLNLSGNDIKQVIEKIGRDEAYDKHETILLAYSGDTPCENFEYWNGADILIHEATFLGGEEDKNILTHGNKHSSLKDVLQATNTIKINKLILGHFSSRYDSTKIRLAVTELCKTHNISIPVYLVLPGQVSFNITGITN